jgi:3-dehydroquinate synthase
MVTREMRSYLAVVIYAYIFRWSPLHELIPETPLRHGHAISIDMAYSATLANSRGFLSDAEHMRLLNLFSRAGLSMDHHQFDEDILDKGTAAIMKTRDGKLRAAVPHPLGSCVFINDLGSEEMHSVLRRHKEIMKQFPRNGEGLEAFVDASDTGYTENNYDESKAIEEAAHTAGSLNGHMNGTNGVPNGVPNGVNGRQNSYANGVRPRMNGKVNGSSKPGAHADMDEAEHGLTNGVNGFTNGAKA